VQQSDRRRRLFVWASELGFTRDERLALAEYLLRRDIQSWDDLSEEQVCRLLDACEGHSLIEELLNQRVVESATSPRSATSADAVSLAFASDE